LQEIPRCAPQQNSLSIGSYGSKPEFTALQQQRPLLLSQRTFRPPALAPLNHSKVAGYNGIRSSPLAAWLEHLRNPQLRAAFGIGFCILFAFIGTFTYVNFTLVRAPLSLGPMELGFVYFVFLPSVVTTLLAGQSVNRFGTQPTLWGSLLIAGIGLPLLLLPNLVAVLLGMVLIGVGTFLAQATATGFVSRTATADRGSASGIYLACYFAGGMVGTAVLGQVFDRLGWSACVTGIALSLAAAVFLGRRLVEISPPIQAVAAATSNVMISTRL
jgi:predicted MFS family arabinose efflux permease